MITEKLIMATYSTVLTKKSSIYCSAPINMHKSFLDRQVDNLDDESIDKDIAFCKETIERNISYANDLVNKIRAKVTCPVINPVAMPEITSTNLFEIGDEEIISVDMPEIVDSFECNQSFAFWQDLIITYVREVVFANGWEYSYFCVSEFYLSQSHSIKCSDENFEPLDISHGIKLIDSAIATIKEKKGDFSARGQEFILDKIKRLETHRPI